MTAQDAAASRNSGPFSAASFRHGSAGQRPSGHASSNNSSMGSVTHVGLAIRLSAKNGAVIDLVIGEGKVSALVQGSRSRPYEVEIRVSPLGKAKMKKVSALCSRELDSLEELVKGKFPKSLETLLTEEGALFPTAREIRFDCSCPDWALMCKHVAAVMYGIGVRLDENPFYFFILRGMDPEALLRHTVEDHVEKLLAHRDVKNDRIIADAEMEKLFHLEEE